MLSRQNRLSLKTDRFRIEGTGQKISSVFFTLIAAPRPESNSPTRFSLLISKKFIGNSVDRHRLKRQLTEIIRLNLEKLPVGKDIILIPKKNLLSASPDEVLSDLIQALSAH